MTTKITEWEFTAEVASWINQIIARNPSLPFVEARCEQRGSGSNRRRDLTILDSSKRPVLTGEVKLPYQKDGSSPLNAAVVEDARKKAARAGAKYFFTWNVNECALWETTPSATDWTQRNYKTWRVTNVFSPNHFDDPATNDAIQKWLPLFLHEVGQILRGAAPIGHKAPDEKFTEALESALRMPILFTQHELAELYRKPKFKSEIDAWMRDDQGWVIYDDPEGIRENLERAAKFACYALVNKLVFHEALLKRYGKKLTKLTVNSHVDSGEALRLHLEGYFATARDVTGDYETVFGEDHRSIGSRIPFFSDKAVTHWRALSNQIHEFDFSKLDYEVIGSLFERLIGPEERHKYGQYYTRVEVVDLINSFCIRTGNETVMDPACGGGTFLVRAYARKRELSPPNKKHGALLADLYGVDVSHFATHLTTINLATRDLIDEENYPQIARSDFFDVESSKAFLTLPRNVSAKGLGKSLHRNVKIPPLDAVVGNPPYVRQEEIRSDKKKGKGHPHRGTKEYFRALVEREASLTLGGRSDIHSYFWPHSASFLKEDGYLCFLTSSQWLDVEYGFRLQAWILTRFRIVAVLESIDEPWFVGARVATTVTILQRCDAAAERAANLVRFVQLRRPIAEILGTNGGGTFEALRAADQFRDEILALSANTANQRYRARLIKQSELWNEGVRLGRIMRQSGESEPDDETEDESEPAGEYFGGKWGVYVRAPDLWFRLLDEFGSRLVPLGDVAENHHLWYLPSASMRTTSDSAVIWPLTTKFSSPSRATSAFSSPSSVVSRSCGPT